MVKFYPELKTKASARGQGRKGLEWEVGELTPREGEELQIH